MQTSSFDITQCRRRSQAMSKSTPDPGHTEWTIRKSYLSQGHVSKVTQKKNPGAQGLRTPPWRSSLWKAWCQNWDLCSKILWLLGSTEVKEKAMSHWVRSVQQCSWDNFTEGQIAPSKNILWVAWKSSCWLVSILTDRTITRYHLWFLSFFFFSQLWFMG